jgi:dihydrofolate reductase
MDKNRSVCVYIAASLDGYIAAPGDDLSFLSRVEQEGEDYGYAAFTETVDTVIIGRKTYDWVMNQVSQFPHADKEAYVITRAERPPVGNTRFYTGDIKELVQGLKGKEGKNIFVDGGAEVVNSLLKEGLVDELIISIIPVLLGAGTRLFQEGFPQQGVRLREARTFEKGLVQLSYQVMREDKRNPD